MPLPATTGAERLQAADGREPLGDGSALTVPPRPQHAWLQPPHRPRHPPPGREVPHPPHPPPQLRHTHHHLPDPIPLCPLAPLVPQTVTVLLFIIIYVTTTFSPTSLMLTLVSLNYRSTYQLSSKPKIKSKIKKITNHKIYI